MINKLKYILFSLVLIGAVACENKILKCKMITDEVTKVMTILSMNLYYRWVCHEH